MGSDIYRFGGSGLLFVCREGTSVWYTVSAIIDHDEYGVATTPVKHKLVFDIGSHIGAFGIQAAARGARVVCVEPIPENVEAIYRNAELNALTSNVLVARGVLGEHGAAVQRIVYGGADVAHAFIGNPQGNETSDRETLAPVWTLTTLIAEFGEPDVVKLDCEGGEWFAFREEARKTIPLIVGEWHPDGVHTQDSVRLALGTTHNLTFSGPDAGPGGFRAERQ